MESGRWRCPGVPAVVQSPELPVTDWGWAFISAGLRHLEDILSGLGSRGPLGSLRTVPRLHPIMWPPRLRLRPSSCFGLGSPASAPTAPRRRLFFLLRPGHVLLGARRRIPARPAGGWGLPPAWARPVGVPEATRPRLDGLARLVLRPQDEGRRGGPGRTGPAEPGGREPRGFGHLPGVRAPRLLGPDGGQSALAAGAQLAPPLPQPGQAESFQPHVCPALGLRHGEGREGAHRVGVKHMGGAGLGAK